MRQAESESCYVTRVCVCEMHYVATGSLCTVAALARGHAIDCERRAALRTCDAKSGDIHREQETQSAKHHLVSLQK